ncbi:phosphate/phosphite/phosphonate ABC transporter substrate-binding protein [Herbaspirillum sp. LeCh32-8]|nr:phosphate/phosphite/phosphonate ABC transporter substrate-binding protein [Herbaspirillum sp. LeCh32-8]
MSAVKSIATTAAVVAALLASSPAVAKGQGACERPQRLRFAVIPQGNDDRQVRAMEPMLELLEKQLKIPVETVTPSSYGSVIEGMLSGTIDIARLGPASYVTAKRGDPMITPFASQEQVSPYFAPGGASAFYYSLLVTRQQGPYDSIASLRGKVLALADPDSTSGALIPRHNFARENHLQLGSYFSRVGYSGNHEQSVLAVMSRNVDAAFVASANLSDMIAAGKVKLSDLRVLWRSKPIPFDPYVYRGQLCADIRNTIRAVFFNGKSPQVKAALLGLGATRFVPVTDANYKIIRELP